MSTPTRVRYPPYPNIQWFDPPIDLTRGRVAGDSLAITNEGVTGVAPELWAMELRFVLDRVRSTEVGRAVMATVRRRATVYPSADNAQTDADPYADNPLDLEPGLSPEEARVLAATSGTNAMIFIDPSAPAERTGSAEAGTPAASLLHELVHAVNITWGAYQDRGYTSAEAARRGAGSPEEEIAWVIDNMHRSETGMWLRQRYDGGGLAPPDSRTLSSSSNTFAMHAVARCNRRLRILAARLEPIPCRYNPFREHAHLPPTARP